MDPYFDHPLAEGQEKSEFAKQIQGFIVALFEGNLLLFVPLFGNTYRDGFNTLGRCTNLVAKHP